MQYGPQVPKLSRFKLVSGWRGLETDAFSAKKFGNRSVNVMQNDERRKTGAIQSLDQTDSGNVTTAQRISNEGKAYYSRFTLEFDRRFGRWLSHGLLQN
jgi:hypothetical protein